MIVTVMTVMMLFRIRISNVRKEVRNVMKLILLGAIVSERCNNDLTPR